MAERGVRMYTQHVYINLEEDGMSGYLGVLVSISHYDQYCLLLNKETIFGLLPNSFNFEEEL